MTSLNTQLDINALVEMGFTRERVELAVKSVKNPEIQTVVEWLFNHPIDDPDSGHRLGSTTTETQTQVESNVIHNSSSTSTSSTVEAVTGMEVRNNPNENDDINPNNEDSINSTTAVSDTPSASPSTACALSLVCEDCGKQIRSEMDAQTHAGRTGHQHFSESSEEVKPLTAEEKEEQKMRLQKKLEERRKQREAAEKVQDKEREKARRITGKEVSQAKEEQAHQEMKRIAEERRREKLEDKRLKQKLKEDIARDRAEFKKQQSNISNKNIAPKIQNAPNQPIVAKKEYNSCRIQFRLMDGSTQNSNFNASDTLQVIYDYLSEQAVCNIPFNLSMTFPRKTFSQQDMLKTLKELGLVPSAVLVLSKV